MMSPQAGSYLQEEGKEGQHRGERRNEAAARGRQSDGSAASHSFVCHLANSFQKSSLKRSLDEMQKKKQKKNKKPTASWHLGKLQVPRCY